VENEKVINVLLCKLQSGSVGIGSWFCAKEDPFGIALMY
jgi:hypothetical protein